MFNVPINRWSILAVLALAAYVGGDLWSTVLRTIGVLAMPYVPAA